MLSVCCKVMTMSAAASIENKNDDNEFWFSHIEWNMVGCTLTILSGGDGPVQILSGRLM